MANVTYLGGKNGQNPELEAAKAEALQIQNELNRLKLEKLKGALIERDKVKFLVADAMVILRSRILDLPRQIIAQLRSFGLDHEQLHGIRMRLEEAARRFLCETIVALERAPNPEEAIKSLMNDDGINGDHMEAIRHEIKHEAGLARRRTKRASEKTPS